MTLPRYKSTPVSLWLGEAFTEFVNGFLRGLGAGTFVGISGGVATASTGLWAGLDWLTHILVALFGFLATGVGNGLKAMLVWHDTHPFPNPWGATPRTMPMTPFGEQ